MIISKCCIEFVIQCSSEEEKVYKKTEHPIPIPQCYKNKIKKETRRKEKENAASDPKKKKKVCSSTHTELYIPSLFVIGYRWRMLVYKHKQSHFLRLLMWKTKRKNQGWGLMWGKKGFVDFPHFNPLKSNCLNVNIEKKSRGWCQKKGVWKATSDQGYVVITSFQSSLFPTFPFLSLSHPSLRK